ncbi:MAG: hypothetical protein QME32_02240, partial [Endomicrobiia bacterium]|nr:hypothetical protein [Endomicrobiia bacterium]
KTAGAVDSKLLDAAKSKYDLVRLASAHVNALKRSHELSGWHVPQIIKKSLDDILSGAVEPADIMAAHKKHLADGDKPMEVIPAAASAPAAGVKTESKPVEKDDTGDKKTSVGKKAKTKK